MKIYQYYVAVPGFFLQDAPDANSTELGAIPPRFGLIDSSPGRWATLHTRIQALNAEADENTMFKLVFLGRHGEGYHNVAEAKYGSEAWDSYWSKLDGDGEVVWGPDAELTPLGEAQAKVAQSVWKEERALFNLPLPDRIYTSPMTRALQTNVLTFDGVDDDLDGYCEKTTVVLENLREVYGEHTCDKRRTKSYIESTFPQFAIERGFTEQDELWTTERETRAHTVSRAHDALDHMFWGERESILQRDQLSLSVSNKNANFISVTAHSGLINALLEVIGRPDYGLPTGGVLPVVIKGNRTLSE